MRKISFILAFLFLPRLEAGGLVREAYESVRATGMGNAFIALADDSNTLWYNPAGLARVKGFHFNLFDLTTGFDSADTLTRMQNALAGNTSNLLRTNSKEYFRAGIKPTLTVPYFGFAIFDTISSYSNLDAINQLAGVNSLAQLQSLPNVDIYSYNDLGAILGFGLPVGPNFSLGASFRAIERTGIDANMSPVQLLQNAGIANPSNFLNAAYSTIQQQMGSGYGLGINLGTLLAVPIGEGGQKGGGARVQFAGTVEDAGDTNFTALSSSTNAPPPIRHSYNFGSALIYELPRQAHFSLSLDFRHLFDGQAFARMFHLGMEYHHRFFSLRAGAYQGQPTLGASFELLPHTRVHFSTYAVELGDGFFQDSQRFYLLQMIVGFNPF